MHELIKCVCVSVSRRLLALGVLTVLLCGQQVSCFSITTSSKRHNFTSEGGPRCTRIGRHCLQNVSCVNKECVCPPGLKGNGLIECVKEKNMLCIVAADPHLVSYNNARVDIDLPCTYRLTRFVTDHRTRHTPFAYCSVEVTGTNELSHGRYYVCSVRISVGIVDSGKQIKDVFEVHKYGTNENRVFRYLSHINYTRIVWGTAAHENIKGVNVMPTFDKDNNFAVLGVPECEVRVKYRAFRPDRHRQSLLPGITIMAPGNSEFLEGYGTYPYSMCGEATDADTLYDDRARELGVRNKRLVVIYDILDNALPQIGNRRAGECKAAFEVFKNATQKVEDINYCGNILTVTKTRLCILRTQEKYQPITVFTACMSFRQNGAAADCEVMATARQQCGKKWKGPDISCGP
ncbi:hypothetical protein ACOMHN_025341 [Nucella lapillus]